MTREERALRQKRAAYLETATNICDRAAAEGRELAPAELKDIEGLRGKARTLALQIEMAGEMGDEAKRSAREMASLVFGGNGGGFGSSARGGSISDGPFQSLGEQLQQIHRAAFQGNQPDPRLYDVSTRAATGMNESVPSDGGFLVQSDFNTMLLDRINASSKVASRCQEIPLSAQSNGIKLPRLDETSRADGSRYGGVLGYWLAEAGQISGTKAKLASTNLELKKVAALVYATDELLQDAAALNSWVSRVASGELAFQLDARIISGNGAGCPLGILNSDAVIEVAKESNQAADTVIAENVIKMFSRLPASSIDTAVWYVSQSVFPQLIKLNIAIGTSGQLIYMPAGGASGKPYNTMFGLPVIPIEQAAKLGDKGDLILADMSKYLLATKGGVQAASSIHVQFMQAETCFRFILRVDGQPENPLPVTPYNGGPTESPFVVLAQRA